MGTFIEFLKCALIALASIILAACGSDEDENDPVINSVPTAKISVSPDPANATLTTVTEIILDGSGSGDPDGDALKYVWSQPTGQGIELSSLSSASTSFTAAEAGTYTFTLTVDDGEFEDSADIEIEVQEPEIFSTNLFGFGQVLVNSRSERSFEFSNDGDSSNSYSLSFSSEVSSAFSTDQPSFSLAAGESTLVTITFAPVGVTEVSTYEGTVIILDSLNEIAGGYDLRGSVVLAYDASGIYQEQLIWEGQNSDFGINAVSGLDFPALVVQTPDGEQVFVTGNGNLTVFDRAGVTGLLRYRSMYNNDSDNVEGLSGAVGLDVSGDSSQVFVTGQLDDSLVVFDRSTSGDLTLRAIFKDGVDGVDGLDGAGNVVVSPENNQVFVTGFYDNALVVFDRDTSGELTYHTSIQDGDGVVEGLRDVEDLAVSPDGRQIFVTGSKNDTLVVFDRDLVSGELSYRQTFSDGQDGVDGLDGIGAIQLSTDGSQIFVTGEFDNAVAVFTRDIDNNDVISYQHTYTNGADGVSGLSGPVSLALSPDNTSLFVSNWDGGVVVFDFDENSLELAYHTQFNNGSFGIAGSGGWGISVSFDGNQFFVAGGLSSDTLSVFRLP